MKASLIAATLTLSTLAGCLTGEEDLPPTLPSASIPVGFLGVDDTLTEVASKLALPVNFRVTTANGPANELTIAVNPKDPLNLVAGAKDYTLGRQYPCNPTYPINVWTGVYWTKDGGKTWANALIPGHPADGKNPGHPNRAYPCNSDPVVGFGPDGTAYYSGLGISGRAGVSPTNPCVETASSIWLMRSTDGGATWTDWSCVDGGTGALVPAMAPGTPVGGGSLGTGVDKQWFAVDQKTGNIYVTYMEFNPSQVNLFLRRSVDGGKTWGPRVAIVEMRTDSPNPQGGLGTRQFSTPAVGPNGEVYVTWRGIGTNGGIFFTRSTNQGQTFEVPRKVQPIDPLPANFCERCYRISTYPVLAADGGSGPFKGHLYVVWSDKRDGDPNVYVTRSADGGTTWSAPHRLNDDRAAGSVQFLPWIAISPNGAVHAAWMDNRSHPGTPEMLDVLYTTSDDGGETWSANVRLNSESFWTKNCNHQSSANFIGDYIGLAASDLAVHPFWPDGRNGGCDGYTATLLPS